MVIHIRSTSFVDRAYVVREDRIVNRQTEREDDASERRTIRCVQPFRSPVDATPVRDAKTVRLDYDRQ